MSEPSWSGAFHRDLFVPFREQTSRMLEGYSYAVYLYIDQLSEKIVGSAKLAKHIGNTPAEYRAWARGQLSRRRAA